PLQRAKPQSSLQLPRPLLRLPAAQFLVPLALRFAVVPAKWCNRCAFDPSCAATFHRRPCGCNSPTILDRLGTALSLERPAHSHLRGLVRHTADFSPRPRTFRSPAPGPLPDAIQVRRKHHADSLVAFWKASRLAR